MANINYNLCVLGGRVVRDPEMKTTSSGICVTSFSVAVQRNYKGDDGQKATDFINCTAWRKTAEAVCKYFKKGSSILCQGQLNVRKWKDKNGNDRYATEVLVDSVFFVDSRGEVESVTVVSERASSSGGEYEEVSEDEIPF